MTDDLNRRILDIKLGVPAERDPFARFDPACPQEAAGNDATELDAAVGRLALLEEGYRKGAAQGYLAAIQDLEGEFTRMVDAGILHENSELGTALAKAAVWLRRKL